ncbi:phosphonopyruvate decarboxylase [Amycolatopsis cihanbeyliensis]|uniref:phosphonopyruvate decarboxylase n=1 Tax=Amycolatopsis cihanbeyliensis TaxID=1128664 RepID=UPI001476AA5A|nr:phosphonopyruvate decarboxylase [Amycolatopsis cihanbeyliensis]
MPCSYASGLYSLLESGAGPYVSSTSEGEAVAIAAGTWLAGAQGMVLCQNSGLGNATNPLSSLTEPFRIPVVLGVSRRGWPAEDDEPQHRMMGDVTHDLLRLLGIPAEDLDAAPGVAAAQLAAAVERGERRESSALVLARTTFDNTGPGTRPVRARPPLRQVERAEVFRAGRRPSRSDVLKTWLELDALRTATVATTGYTSRALYGLDDRPNHFYMPGSMGCAPAIGVGLATASRHPVAVFDGDGALLMRMGTLATAGRYVRTPFLHIVLDNGQHESTGGQRSNAEQVDFANVALACGYRAAWRCDGIDAVLAGLKLAADRTEGPVLLHCLIRPGADESLPRPREALPDLALRFRTHLAETEAAVRSHGDAHGTAFHQEQRTPAPGPEDGQHLDPVHGQATRARGDVGR